MSEKKHVLDVKDIGIEAIKPPEDGEELFRAEKLFHNINIHALEGEIVLLLGGSGTGKSLLTNLLLGFTTPQESTIMIKPSAADSDFKLCLDAQDAKLLSPIYPSSLEGKIGVMFQSLGLFDDLTVEENLSFANDHSTHPKKGHDWNVWKKEIISTLGLPPNILQCELNKLSGGQRQRVAFGRLLAFSPKIMIFDEPTSALDYSSARQVVSLIKKTHEENENVLSIIITHDYENFLSIADRVCFINHKQGIENDAPPKDASYYQSDLAQKRKPSIREIQSEEHLSHTITCYDMWWNTCIQKFLKTIKQSLNPKAIFGF